MLLIDCPYCGPRAELEFSCGGEAHIARPLNTESISTQYERWNHARGCRRWFNVARDTVTHKIYKVYKMGEPKP